MFTSKCIYLFSVGFCLSQDINFTSNVTYVEIGESVLLTCHRLHDEYLKLFHPDSNENSCFNCDCTTHFSCTPSPTSLCAAAVTAASTCDIRNGNLSINVFISNGSFIGKWACANMDVNPQIKTFLPLIQFGELFYLLVLHHKYYLGLYNIKSL